jgi:hypothetical protein
MRMSLQTKTGLGGALATIGALVLVLSLLLGWYSNPRPWVFPLAFASGVAAGIGATLGISGLLEGRHERKWGAGTVCWGCELGHAA